MVSTAWDEEPPDGLRVGTGIIGGIQPPGKPPGQQYPQPPALLPAPEPLEELLSVEVVTVTVVLVEVELEESLPAELPEPAPPGPPGPPGPPEASLSEDEPPPEEELLPVETETETEVSVLPEEPLSAELEEAASEAGAPGLSAAAMVSMQNVRRMAVRVRNSCLFFCFIFDTPCAIWHNMEALIKI